MASATMHTTEELKAAGYSIENARITNVSLNMNNHACFTLDITLEGGGWGVVYGGYCLGKVISARMSLTVPQKARKLSCVL